MGMAENKHLTGSHDKNAENAIFRTCDEDTSILGEKYNAGNRCRNKEKRGRGKLRIRWSDDLKSVIGRPVND